MPAALVPPADERVVEALARLGMATVSVIGPVSVRERLEGRADPEGLAADIEALARLLARL